jgi:hypothetical protein
VIKPRLVLAGATDPRTLTVCLNIFLGAATEWNAWLFRDAHRQGWSYPATYSGLLRYQREDYGSQHPEDWRDAREVFERRGGDCEDLSCYLSAELRLQGYPHARPVFRYAKRSDGGRLWHILVDRGDGSPIEDPSKLLGMRGAA